MYCTALCPPSPALGSLGTGGFYFVSLWMLCAALEPSPPSTVPFLPLPLSNALDFKCHSQATQAFGNILPRVGGPSTAPSHSSANSWFASSGSSPSHTPLITSSHFHTHPLGACVWRKCHEVWYLILEASLGHLKLLLIIDGV